MIAADTSTLVTYLAGGTGSDVDLLDDAIEARVLVLPPAVLTEILSVPGRADAMADLLAGVPLLETRPGYWERAGLLRARVLAHGFKGRVADALIAQSCIDHDAALITRDRDFRHFARYGLRTAP
jgi:predicted nucleic acid-binding protein